MALAKLVYNFSKALPADELYGLSSQMRRAAVSVSSNIAEGFYRGSNKEFKKFLGYAAGSAAELETQILLSVELGFCNNQKKLELVELISEVRKMLSAFITKLNDQG